jgi:hypothetical protein
VTQIALPINWSQINRRRAIIVGEGNRQALAFLSQPGLWPSHCSLLVGPHRSGRSTIAATIAELGAIKVVDDADSADESMLFHSWNLAREAEQPLLLVAAAPPPIWTITLPDLRSRVSAAGIAQIRDPDEAMVAELIAQALVETGTAFAPDVPPYLAARLPRCYQTVDSAIAALNGESLSSGRKISLLKAKQVLGGIGLLSED